MHSTKASGLNFSKGPIIIEIKLGLTILLIAYSKHLNLSLVFIDYKFPEHIAL